MGTRSDIIVKKTDGTFARTYCHWDGYLEHNGRILFDSYTSQTQVEALVALGGLSVLDDSIECPEGHTFDHRVNGHTLAYHRDRGDELDIVTGDTLAAVWPGDDTWTEFTYVWDNGKWWVGDPDEGSQTLIDLGDALTGKKTLRPAVKACGMVLGQHNAVDVKDGHSWSSK